jgi:hypothetical protein
MPTLARRIRLDPTPDQIRYFKQVSGTARFCEMGRWMSARAHMRPKPVPGSSNFIL